MQCSIYFPTTIGRKSYRRRANSNTPWCWHNTVSPSGHEGHSLPCSPLHDVCGIAAYATRMQGDVPCRWVLFVLALCTLTSLLRWRRYVAGQPDVYQQPPRPPPYVVRREEEDARGSTGGISGSGPARRPSAPGGGWGKRGPSPLGGLSHSRCLFSVVTACKYGMGWV
jgi:hypothetical protein